MPKKRAWPVGKWRAGEGGRKRVAQLCLEGVREGSPDLCHPP